jgi:hypothetical protein
LVFYVNERTRTGVVSEQGAENIFDLSVGSDRSMEVLYNLEIYFVLFGRCNWADEMQRMSRHGWEDSIQVTLNE